MSDRGKTFLIIFFGFMLIGSITMVAATAASWQNFFGLLAVVFFIASIFSRLD